ncbi:MAG: hypothetical protein AAFN40_18505 [Cyanobacteria bacterium J06560_6]
MKNAEVVDEIELTLEQKKAKKPDFFFCNRQFIGEMKSLNADTEYKASAILEKQQERPEFPIFFGSWESEKILNCLPDGEYVKERMIKAITSGLKKSLKKANRQIRDSKKTYSIESAEGILIIINDSVEILSPEVIAYRVSQVMGERNPSGELLCPDIAVVLILGSLHTMHLEHSQEVLPAITVINSYTTDYEMARDYTGWLQKKWAEFNNMPLIERDISPELLRTSKREEPQPYKQLTRSDLWRKDYRNTPYLRQLPEDELMSRGQEIMYEMVPFFLRGSHESPSEQRALKLLELNTHLMEEFNHRGLDFRKLSSAIDAVKAQLAKERLF